MQVLTVLPGAAALVGEKGQRDEEDKDTEGEDSVSALS